MISLLIKRKITTTMLFSMMVLMGFISLYKTSVTLLPEIRIPRLIVLTKYPLVSAQEVSNLVTSPIESTISSVGGVKTLMSRSEEGLSIIYVDLAWGYDIDMAILSLRQKLDLIRNILPQDVNRSIILKYDPNKEPIVQFLVHPEGIPYKKLRDFLDKELKQDLERIDGVASIVIEGGEKRELKVLVDQKELFAMGSSLTEVVDILKNSNYNFPAGNITEGDTEYTIRSVGDFKTIAAIKNTIIGLSKSGVPIKLEEVARVVDGYKKKHGVSLFDGQEAILVNVYKEPEENTIRVSKQIEKTLPSIVKKYTNHFDLELIHDSSVYIGQAISSLKSNAIFGAFIAFIVLFVFLQNFRSAVIILVSIPIAILSTFVMMYFFDISINIISLGGLALGVGMLVDNSIVVLESIQFEFEKNSDLSKEENTYRGVHKVLNSCVASTLTTIIVFLPILFVEGIAGELFKDLALTVTFSLVSSLLIAMGLVPMLLTIDFFEIKVSQGSFFLNLVSKVYLFSSAVMVHIKDSYELWIPKLISGYVLSAISGLFIVFLGILGIVFIPKSIFPKPQSNIVEGFIELKAGTTLEDSVHFARRLSRYMRRKELVEKSIIKIGYDKENIYDLVEGKKEVNYMELKLFLDEGQRISSQKFLEEISPILFSQEDIAYNFQEKGDFLGDILQSNDDKLNIDVISNNNQANEEVTKMFLSNIPVKENILAVDSTIHNQSPEVEVSLDIQKMSTFGLQVANIARVLKTSVEGRISTYFREDDQEIPIRVLVSAKDRDSIKSLESLFLKTPSKSFIRLEQIMEFKEQDSPSVIYKSNGQKMHTIEIQYAEGKKKELYNTLSETIEKVENDLSQGRFGNMPEIVITDPTEKAMESLIQLFFAFLLSTVLIYMLLAGQFESYVHPFSVVLSVPLVLPFVALSLFLSKNTLSIMSGMGIIMLVGLVVNSSILLYEYIRRVRANYSKTLSMSDLIEIIQVAGRERIRPIVLTTLTTTLGLVPMGLSLGEGGELQAPLAIVVLFGLLSSVFLTFLYFPVYFVVFEKLLEKIRK